MELRRHRGEATFLAFPIVNGSGTLVAGISGPRPQYATFTNAIAPNNKFSTISNATLTEIGQSGWYYASLTATEMANDYILFVASPTSGLGRPVSLLIDCTAIASVTNVGSVTYAVPLNWASISGTGAAVNLTGTQIASVNNPAPILWSSITSPGFANNLTGTQVASVNNPVGILWSSITSPSFANNLTGTRVASVNNPVPINWASVTNPGAVNDLSGTSIATVSFATVGGVSTVTGVTNTVQANVAYWLNVAPNLLTGGRVDSYAAVLNWASVTAPTTAVNLTGTQIASVNNPVPLLWSSITSPGASNALTGTTVASVNNPVGILWSSLTSPGFANNLTGTQIASVNNPVPVNWASVTNPGATNVLALTTIGTATQVSTVDQVRDLRTTTYPELTATPSAVSTALDRLGWLYALSLNDVQISSLTQVVFNFGHTATLSVATHSDSTGLFTRNKWQ